MTFKVAVARTYDAWWLTPVAGKNYWCAGSVSLVQTLVNMRLSMPDNMRWSMPDQQLINRSMTCSRWRLRSPKFCYP